MGQTENMFQPVETVRASQAVYEQIEGLILNKKIAVGQKLPSERELMKIFHKSHQTIREALRMLETMGYIEVNHGGAAIVKYSSDKIMKENLLDILQHGRIAFGEMMEFVCNTEPAFLKGAYRNVSWEDELALKKCLEELRASDAPREYARALFAFHRQFIKLTRNMLLYIIWESFYQHMDTIPMKGTIRPEEIKASVAMHEELLLALRGKDEEAADRILTEIFDLIKKVLER